MKHIDLCSGVGGFSVAAMQACPRIECVGFSEVLSYAEEAYRANFPNVPRLGDAEAVTQWPNCTLLTAGFPCQPFSNASSREQRKTHSKLNFYEIVLEAIKKSGATRIVLENVANIMTVGSTQWDSLIEVLKLELGFVLHHGVLDAFDFGLLQRRKRVYLVGRRDGGEVLPLRDFPPHAPATLSDILEASGI